MVGCEGPRGKNAPASPRRWSLCVGDAAPEAPPLQTNHFGGASSEIMTADDQRCRCGVAIVKAWVSRCCSFAIASVTPLRRRIRDFISKTTLGTGSFGETASENPGEVALKSAL